MGKKVQKVGGKQTDGGDVPADDPVVIAKWDSAAVKNTLDDFVHKYALELNEDFVENHWETDVRLAICTVACAFAGFACLYGFLIPHPESATVVGSCVLGYFTLVTLLSIYQAFFEEPALVTASAPTTESKTKAGQLKVCTFMERYSTKYTIEMTFTPGGNDSAQEEKQTASTDCNIGHFFYEDGELCKDNVLATVKALSEDVLKGSKRD
eukprot:m.33235 g.33235  ORF g.33235 m.33235 type:complete len:210 (+) comp14217_c0_seq1:51-680(+)